MRPSVSWRPWKTSFFPGVHGEIAGEGRELLHDRTHGASVGVDGDDVGVIGQDTIKDDFAGRGAREKEEVAVLGVDGAGFSGRQVDFVDREGIDTHAAVGGGAGAPAGDEDAARGGDEGATGVDDAIDERLGRRVGPEAEERGIEGGVAPGGGVGRREHMGRARDDGGTHDRVGQMGKRRDGGRVGAARLDEIQRGVFGAREGGQEGHAGSPDLGRRRSVGGRRAVGAVRGEREGDRDARRAEAEEELSREHEGRVMPGGGYGKFDAGESEARAFPALGGGATGAHPSSPAGPRAASPTRRERAWNRPKKWDS